MLKLRRLRAFSVGVLFLGMMLNAYAAPYSCAADETSLLDSFVGPNMCGGMSLFTLHCVRGNIQMRILELTCKSDRSAAGQD